MQIHNQATKQTEIEYQLAVAESQKIIGEVELVKNAEIPEGSKRLNQLWSNNITKLKQLQK